MRILLVKLSSLGDVVQTVPVVADLWDRLGEVSIDWVVEEAFAPLLARVQGLERVVPVALRRWRRQGFFSPAVRQERARFRAELAACAYDAVLDLQGLTKSAVVARSARLAPGGFTAGFGNASEECGYEWPARWLVDRPQPMPRRIHAVDRTRLLAALAFGYAGSGLLEQPPRYALQVNSEGLAERAVLLAHGTTRDDNRWPREAWLGLARRLLDGGWKVWLPQADDREAAWAEALASQLDGGVQVLPRLPLPQLLDRMAATCGVIGVDSGVSHMAVALGLPHVQIFSHDRAWRAGPKGHPRQKAVGGARAPSQDEVWQAWQEVSGDA